MSNGKNIPPIPKGFTEVPEVPPIPAGFTSVDESLEKKKEVGEPSLMQRLKESPVSVSGVPSTEYHPPKVPTQVPEKKFPFPEVPEFPITPEEEKPISPTVSGDIIGGALRSVILTPLEQLSAGVEKLSPIELAKTAAKQAAISKSMGMGGLAAGMQALTGAADITFGALGTVVPAVMGFNAAMGAAQELDPHNVYLQWLMPIQKLTLDEYHKKNIEPPPLLQNTAEFADILLQLAIPLGIKYGKRGLSVWAKKVRKGETVTNGETTEAIKDIPKVFTPENVNKIQGIINETPKNVPVENAPDIVSKKMELNELREQHEKLDKETFKDKATENETNIKNLQDELNVLSRTEVEPIAVKPIEPTVKPTEPKVEVEPAELFTTEKSEYTAKTPEKWGYITDESGKKIDVSREVYEKYQIKREEKAKLAEPKAEGEKPIPAEALKDVGSTAKALTEKNIYNETVKYFTEKDKIQSQAQIGENGKTKFQFLSELYHKAKSDGSNPELVKAVEDLASELPKETSESVFKEHLTTGTKEQAGKYHIEKVGDEIKILNVQSGKYVKPAKQNQWAIDQYIEANKENFKKGKETEGLEENINTEQAASEIANKSENPFEIATAWIWSEAATSDIPFIEIIYEHARNINLKSFSDYTGFKEKKITPKGKIRLPDYPWLEKRLNVNGKPLDAIAENISQYLPEYAEGISAVGETAKPIGADLISRIMDVLQSSEFKEYKPGSETQTRMNLADKFKQLTGLDLNNKVAKKITDHQNTLDKWAGDIEKYAGELPDVGLPFIIAPRLLKFGLLTVAKALRAGASLQRAIKLAIIKIREMMQPEEKFDEEEFRDLVRKKGMKIAIPEGKEIHQFAERIQEDKELPHEFNRNLKDPYYTPISNIKTVEEANKFIQENGIEMTEKITLSENSNLPFEQRVAMGVGLIDKYLTEKKYDKAIMLADMLSGLGEKLGRGVQAFSLWKKIVSTPEGALRLYKKTIEEIRNKKIEANQELIDKLKEEVNKTNREAIEKMLPTLRDEINKFLKRRHEQMVKETKDIDKRETIWGKYKKQAIGNLKSDIINRLAGDVKEQPALAEFTKRLSQNLRQKIKELFPEEPKEKREAMSEIEVIADAIKNFEKTKEVWEQTREELTKKWADQPEKLAKLDEYFGQLLDKPFSELSIEKAIKQQLKESGESINDIIRRHYTDQEEAKKKIVDKLIEKAGLNPDEAKKLSDEISKKFDEISSKAKRDAIEKMLTIRQKLNKKIKTFAEKLIELSNMGALDDPTTLKAFSEKFDLPELNTDVVKQLTDMANEIQKMPEGKDKTKRVIDLLNIIGKQKGIKGQDIFWGYWYASILSSPQTHLLNAGSLSVNTPLLLTQESIKGVRSWSDLSMMMRSLLKGYKEGYYSAKDIMKEGYDVYDIHNPEISPTMELIKNSENKFYRILSNARYVRRAMVAADMIFKGGLNEMKQTMIELQIAKEQGLKGEALKNEVNNRLYNTEEATAEAVQQAIDEKYDVNTDKGIRRVSEILQQKRPKETTEAGRQFSIEGTLNQDPSGLLGSVANGINKFTKDISIAKLIIPFTRIIANATNLSLDYTPWGYKRAMLGRFKFEKGELKLEELSSEERTNKLIRATIGTSLMAAVYYMDSKGIIEVTGAGTGNVNKDRELMNSGWKKYSLKIGNTYFNYLYTPLAIPLSIIGNIKDNQRYKKLEDKDILDRLAFIVFGSANTIFNQSYLSGLISFTELFDRKGQDVTEGFQKFISKTTTSVIPNLFKYIDKVFDPTIARPDDFKTYMLKEIPIARELTTKKQINVLGEPVGDSKTFVERFFNNFIGIDKKDVWSVLRKKGVSISVPNKQNEFISGVPMDDDEYDEYITKSGKLIKQDILDAQPNLAAMNTAEAQQWINQMSERHRTEIRIQMGIKGLKRKHLNLRKVFEIPSEYMRKRQR